jgi:hypothetical protein
MSAKSLAWIAAKAVELQDVAFNNSGPGIAAPEDREQLIALRLAMLSIASEPGVDDGALEEADQAARAMFDAAQEPAPSETEPS